MWPVKKNNIPPILSKDDEEPVYEGEVIDNEQEKTALTKKEISPVQHAFAYNLGKFAGSLISSAVLLGKVLNLFKKENICVNRCKSSGGRGRRNRQRNGKGCLYR
ncbi:MAG: hypothetical protein MUF15_21120 [Acidobacteria bacterium]|jgi:hypothetical protein|nr:hypothetical protein [Acidobacteriota bacterium]